LGKTATIDLKRQVLDERTLLVSKETLKVKSF
jgi:hypothetical protein